MLEAMLAHQKIIPVITLDRVEDAVPLAEALSGGGLNVLEVTFRTEAAAGAIQTIVDQVPAVTVGAGTVTTPAILQAADAAGAAFFVSPGASFGWDAFSEVGVGAAAAASVLCNRWDSRGKLGGVFGAAICVGHRRLVDGTRRSDSCGELG